MTEQHRVLVLGASGMLGHTVLRVMVEDPAIVVWGTTRSAAATRMLGAELQSRTVTGIDVLNVDDLMAVFARVRPTVVVNCIGLVKQLAAGEDPMTALPINSIFPHRLARLCAVARARMVHISTDCVFSGRKGMYLESDLSDAEDVYGKSKYMGEVGGEGAITLRTSIIGHELGTKQGLVEWFLAQQSAVKGYRKAIFSGLPTVELARVIHDCVLPDPSLTGVYHVSAEPINKFELLQVVAKEYDHAIAIDADDRVRIDRSLDSTRFRSATGYVPAAWPELIRRMRAFH